MRYAQTRQQRRCYFIQYAAVIVVAFLIASACPAQTTPAAAPPELPWLQDLTKNPELLAEFGKLIERFRHDIHYPPARGASDLLPRLPESTLAYAAFPNYGAIPHQALMIFRHELEESEVLRNWWQHIPLATFEPAVEEPLERIYQVSQYLGDEIVVSGTMTGPDPKLLVVGEVRKPGLEKLLPPMLNDLAAKSKVPMRVLEPKELATAKDSQPEQELLVLVRPDFVAAALNLSTLRDFNARLDRGGREFASTPFAQRLIQEYDGTLNVLGAVDVHGILKQVPLGTQENQLTFQRTGFADMKYLISEHKTVAGQPVNQAEVSFIRPRHGIASWLAAPAPLGSLDFVSPKATMVSAVQLKNLAQIFDDLKEISGPTYSGAFAALTLSEQAWKLNLKDDLLDPLGGEITVELDDVTPPKPQWKAILRVKDSHHLQQTLSTLLAAVHMGAEQLDEGGVTYSSIRIPSGKTAMEVQYAFVEGYLIIASSHQQIAEAIRLHNSGESLAKSKKFLATLPAGQSSDVSALFYEDPIAMIKLQLQQESPEMAGPLAQFSGASTPVLVRAYAEETAIRETSTSAAFDTGAVLGMAAIAIPNLLRSKIAANEASAVGTVRTVNVAELTYAVTYPERHYAPDLATLGPDPSGTVTHSANHAGFLESVLGNPSCAAGAWCTKSGFRFSLTAVCKQKLCNDFVVVGTPVSSNTGVRSFCSTSDGVIRFKTGPPLISPVNASECRAWSPLQ